jgi:hypothetical protein
MEQAALSAVWRRSILYRAQSLVVAKYLEEWRAVTLIGCLLSETKSVH